MQLDLIFSKPLALLGVSIGASDKQGISMLSDIWPFKHALKCISDRYTLFLRVVSRLNGDSTHSIDNVAP